MTEQEVVKILKEKGLRPTAQRVAMYQYLLTHPEHPRAEVIHENLPFPCSLMTIYNTMDALIEAGLVRLVTIEPGVKRFDANANEHGHFRCKQCGTVYDFPFSAENMQVSHLDGFQIADHDVYCSGICRNCVTKKH